MLLEGKKALILGVANNRSIAWGITQQFKQAGARLAFSYVNDAIKKRVEPLSEEVGGEFTFKCDVSSDEDIAAAAALVKEKWGDVDILVHSLAFANRDDLNYSLVALTRAFEPLMHDGSSILAMTYLGSTRVVPSYNVMGVAKAALECSMRYLSFDLGAKGIRINCISSGPIKTLAASAVHSLKSSLSVAADMAAIHRNVEPTDVGGLATFLASDLGRAVTGQVIYCDNGFSNSVGKV